MTNLFFGAHIPISVMAGDDPPSPVGTSRLLFIGGINNDFDTPSTEVGVGTSKVYI